MKTLIIYVSVHHQNTARIAQVLAEVLQADLKNPEEMRIESFKDYDLVGFGSGIYFGRYHRKVYELIKSLPKQEGKKAFIFSTSGTLKIINLYDFDKHLKRKLEERGFSVIGQFNCRGWDSYPKLLRPWGGINRGRPDSADFEKARRFAEKIIENSRLKA